MTNRTDRLRGFLAAWDGIPMEYGTSDCSIVPAMWVSEETGRTVEWPDYASEEEARELIGEAGGLVHLWRAVADEVGLSEVQVGCAVPALGDIGIVDTRMHGPIGGIFARHGLIYVRCDPTEDNERGMRPLTWRPGRSAIAAWSLEAEH